MKKLGQLISDSDLENKLKINYGIDIFSTELLKETSLLNWRVIFELKNTLYLSSSLFKTKKEGGWIEEFYIYTMPIYSSIIFLVSDNCPEYLFVDPADLVDPIKEYIEGTSINLYNSLNLSLNSNVNYDDLKNSYISTTTSSSSTLLNNTQTISYDDLKNSYVSATSHPFTINKFFN